MRLEERAAQAENDLMERGADVSITIHKATPLKAISGEVRATGYWGETIWITRKAAERIVAALGGKVQW